MSRSICSNARFPRWLVRLTDVSAAALGALVFGLIAWNMWKAAGLSQMLNLSTNIIGLPKDWFQFFVVACSVITTFGMTLRAVSLSLGAPTKWERHAS